MTEILKSTWIRLLAAWGGLWLCAGCQWPQPNSQPATPVTGKISLDNTSVTVKPSPQIEADKIAPHDDIIDIHSTWSQDPWVKDPDGRPVGFRTRVYFVSGQTERGEFVPGTILIQLFQVHKDPDGGPAQRQLVHRWVLDEQKAMGFRVRKLAVMGYSYGFILKWPDQLAPIIADCEIMFSYQRGDGRLVSAPSQRIAELGLGKFRRPAPAAPRSPSLEARR